MRPGSPVQKLYECCILGIDFGENSMFWASDVQKVYECDTLGIAFGETSRFYGIRCAESVGVLHFAHRFW